MFTKQELDTITSCLEEQIKQLTGVVDTISFHLDPHPNIREWEEDKINDLQQKIDTLTSLRDKIKEEHNA